MKDITTGSIFTGEDGDISLTSNNGIIDTSGGTLNSSSETGNGGAVTLTALKEIITGAINTRHTDLATSGNGGAITLTSGASIDTSAGELVSTSIYGDGGTVTLNADENIITDNIVTFSGGNNASAGNAGNIFLTSTTGAIDSSAGFLDAGANIGNGGTISLNGSRK